MMLSWVSCAAFCACSLGLLSLTLHGISAVWPIYAVLLANGVVRAFNGPVSRALLPQLVPEEHFPNAVAWASGVFQTATILGPSIGGVVYAAFRGPGAVYALAMISSLVEVKVTLVDWVKAGVAVVTEPTERERTVGLTSRKGGVTDWPRGSL